MKNLLVTAMLLLGSFAMAEGNAAAGGEKPKMTKGQAAKAAKECRTEKAEELKGKKGADRKKIIDDCVASKSM